MTVLGALVGTSVVVYVLHHGNMLQFLLNGEAIILIFGGTLGSVLISYPWDALRHVRSAVMLVIFPPKRPGATVLIATFMRLAEKARRQGLESLAPEAGAADHPFLADGLQMLGDGLEREVLQERFERDILATRQRHMQLSGIFRAAGTFSPIFGLLGTLIGVVQVLRNITNPSAMGSAMAVAMTASFYGIFAANFVFLPVANKLNYYSEEEMLNRELIARGILCLLDGASPWLVARKLEAYMSFHLRRAGAKRYKVPA
ncbi:MAG: MotA/TolQ/ExbB proton channel family protein [Elusimicrobia bacterium]|nr:MotA/TolQ/ExbB proton channel family protein [Elusimicrobiota bacterium]